MELTNPATADLSDQWTEPEQGEGEDFVDYLGRKADHYTQSPPPAPPGFELVECDAEPRHWPVYTHADSDFYPMPCLYCVNESTQKAVDALERRYHWLKHPLRGRWAIRLLGKLYSLGVIAGYGTHYGGATDCNRCIEGIRLRGRRPYVLGWPDWKWSCLITRRHWPGEGPLFGMCGKCVPCPDCGTTKLDHNCPGSAQ